MKIFDFIRGTFKKPDYKKLFVEQVLLNNEQYKETNRRLVALMDTMTELSITVSRQLTAKPKQVLSAQKVLSAQNREALSNKVVEILLTHGDGLSQGAILAALGKTNCDKTALSTLHYGIGKLWTVARDGNACRYSLISKAE